MRHNSLYLPKIQIIMKEQVIMSNVKKIETEMAIDFGAGKADLLTMMRLMESRYKDIQEEISGFASVWCRTEYALLVFEGEVLRQSLEVLASDSIESLKNQIVRVLNDGNEDNWIHFLEEQAGMIILTPQEVHPSSNRIDAACIDIVTADNHTMILRKENCTYGELYNIDDPECELYMYESGQVSFFKSHLDIGATLCSDSPEYIASAILQSPSSFLK
jgi:hypothetical protein